MRAINLGHELLIGNPSALCPILYTVYEYSVLAYYSKLGLSIAIDTP